MARKLLDYHELYERERETWPALDETSLPGEVLALLPGAEERLEGDLVVLDLGRVFQQLDALAAWFLSATAEQRLQMRLYVKPDGAEPRHVRSQLVRYSLTAAVAGARESSPAQVLRGVAAFAMVDLTSDVRDVMLSMAVLLDCAQQSGAEPGALFAQAAATAGPATAAVLVDFAERTPGPSLLGAMGWTRVDSAEGAGYLFLGKSWPVRHATRNG